MNSHFNNMIPIVILELLFSLKVAMLDSNSIINYSKYSLFDVLLDMTVWTMISGWDQFSSIVVRTPFRFLLVTVLIVVMTDFLVIKLTSPTLIWKYFLTVLVFCLAFSITLRKDLFKMKEWILFYDYMLM